MSLFSGVSPNYQASLQNELYDCFKYIGIPYSELLKMPIKDRKFIIKKHNENTNKENKQNSKSMELNGDMTAMAGEQDLMAMTRGM